MRNHGLAILFAAGLLGGFLAAGGCSHDSTTGSGGQITPEDQTIDLNAPYGGFLAVDEAPAFGDASLQSEAAEDEQQADGFAGLSIRERDRVRQLEDEHPDHYALTAIWGDLRNAGAGITNLEDPPYTWDGSMSLSAGAIRLLSLIDFERPEDGILPRTLPADIEWTSVTHGDRDGLRVWLIVPQGAVPETLHVKIGDYTRDFLTSELENLSENEEIADSLQISLRAFRADPAVSLSGFLRGHWGWVPGDSVGRFQGLWVRGDDGRLMGVMRGHYGTNAQNQPVFFGKFIDLNGHFEGLLRGTWTSATEGIAGTPGFRETGTFTGRWVNEKDEDLGELQGAWQRRGAYGGVFIGSWKALGPGL